jgi:hypothetical protein
MRRWHIRRLVIWGLVFTALIWLVFWRKLPLMVRWGVPGAVGVFLFIFGWYDIARGLEKDDPARAEFEKEMKELNARESETKGRE